VYHVVRSPDYDWIALYHDGALLTEGHSIQEEDLLRVLGIDFTHQEFDFAEHGAGHAPNYLNDLGKDY
jgi:hypothetical protein